MTGPDDTAIDRPATPPPAVLRGALVAAVAITIVIAMASFVLSFSVLWDLATMAGLPHQLSWLWPVVVDGTILQATISVVALAPYEQQRRGRRFFWAVLGVSALVSVASNAVHAVVAATADLPPMLAAAIATAAPISLLAATHGIAVLSKLKVETPAVEVTSTKDVITVVDQVRTVEVELIGEPEEQAPQPVTEQVPSVVDEPGKHHITDDTWDRVAAQLERDQLTTRPVAEVTKILQLRYAHDMSKTQIARELALHHSTVGRVLDAAASVLRPQPAGAHLDMAPRPSRPRKDPAAGVLTAVR